MDCGCPGRTSRPRAAMRTARLACRRSRCSARRDYPAPCRSPAGARTQGGRRARTRGPDPRAAPGSRAARLARTVVGHAPDAGTVCVARRGAAQPLAAAAPHPAASHYDGRSARDLAAIPDAFRPRAGHRAAGAVLGAEAPRDAHASRRSGGRFRVLLPPHHQFSLFAKHSHGTADGRGSGRDHGYARRLQRPGPAVARQSAQQRVVAGACRARRTGAVPAVSPRARADVGAAPGRAVGRHGIVRHDVTGQRLRAGAVRRAGFPGRICGSDSLAPAALLAWPGTVGLRLPQLARRAGAPVAATGAPGRRC